MPYRGSHRTSEKDGVVTIHRLEVFSGFDATIDNAKNDPEIATYDVAKTRKLFDNTVAMMERGQLPQVVERHDKPGRVVSPHSLGNTPKLYFEERGGVGVILSDAQMKTADFEKYLASNQYPRRSAEINTQDLRIHQVALMGREAPRRPLPDTRFMLNESDGVSLLSSEVPTLTNFEAMLPCPPELASKNGKKKKSDKDKDEHMADNESIEALRAEIAALTTTVTSLQSQKATMLNERDTAIASATKASNDRIATLEATNVQMECERLVDQMERDGFAFGADVKKEMVAELAASPDRAKTHSRMRQIGRKLEFNELPAHLRGAPNGAPAVQGAPGAPKKISAQKMMECQQKAVDPDTGLYNPAKFNSLMEAASTETA